MQTFPHLWQYLARFFSKWEMFQIKVVEKIQFSLKSDKNNGTLHEDFSTLMTISRKWRTRGRKESLICPKGQFSVPEKPNERFPTPPLHPPIITDPIQPQASSHLWLLQFSLLTWRWYRLRGPKRRQQTPSTLRVKTPQKHKIYFHNAAI
jgi:hypothetical protein